MAKKDKAANLSVVPQALNVNPNVVTALETALDLARKGELREIALGGRLSNGSDYSAYSVYDATLMIGLLQMAQFGLMRDTLDAS